MSASEQPHPREQGTPRPATRFLRRLGAVVAVLFAFGAVSLLLGLAFPYQAAFHLLVGWLAFLQRTIPEVSLDGGGILLGLLCLAGLGLVGHRFARWLASERPEPIDWRPRWTLLSLALFVLIFVSSIATVGLAHQTIWLFQDDVVTNPMLDRQKQKRSMGDLRTIATAVESYRLDHGRYPVLDGEASLLRPLVEPTYIRDLPVTDGWGGSYLYASEGTSYTLLGLGKDGEPSAPRLGALSDARQDLVFADGAFRSWP